MFVIICYSSNRKLIHGISKRLVPQWNTEWTNTETEDKTSEDAVATLHFSGDLELYPFFTFYFLLNTDDVFWVDQLQFGQVTFPLIFLPLILTASLENKWGEMFFTELWIQARLANFITNGRKWWFPMPSKIFLLYVCMMLNRYLYWAGFSIESVPGQHKIHFYSFKDSVWEWGQGIKKKRAT